jgi:hypothetical protein
VAEPKGLAAAVQYQSAGGVAGVTGGWGGYPKPVLLRKRIFHSIPCSVSEFLLYQPLYPIFKMLMRFIEATEGKATIFT